MLPVKLVGKDNNSVQTIDQSGASLNIIKPIPPFKPDQRMRVFRQHLTDDGLPTDGTNQDMRVNGSSTNVDFYVGSHNDRDRYICFLSFIIADASATLDGFGNLSALTNGCVLEYIDEAGTVTIHDGIKTNFQLIRLCGGTPAIGNTTNAFRASNVSGSAEGYIPFLDLRTTFGFQWGILLKAGSTQRITFRIRDDLSTGIDSMDCIAYGFERLKD